MLDQINVLSSNKIPTDRRGDELNKLEFKIDDKVLLNKLADCLITNNQFKGEVIIYSDYFDDLVGYKIVKIIEKNNLTVLKLGNRNRPFSDRITASIGDALLVNTSLKILETYMDVNELAVTTIVQFLTNKNSSLESIKYLKITNGLLNNLQQYFNKSNKLKNIGFYYEPFVSPELLYSKNLKLIQMV